MTDETARLLARRARLLGPSYRVLYDEPLHFVRGEGVWLYDASGRAYLDAYNNVPCVGHCHPRVVAALARQAAILNTHTRYLHEGVLDYAEQLLATVPAPIEQVIFTCTGSEANDLALRVARAATGATGFIVTETAYHGVTAALAEMSPSLGVALGSHVRTVPAPDSYRTAPGDLGPRFEADVRAAVGALAEAGLRPAALLLDTIFASDGIHPGPAGFVAGAVAAIREAGGLFIADEVQAGFGRTGPGFWGFARHGIVPDLVTLGKPMGAGHPVAALVARPEHLAAFGRQGRYFNTFGGNPVSAAVGSEVLRVIADEGLAENAAAAGRRLLAGLTDLQARHPVIGDVRGAGLYVGVEIVSDPAGKTPQGALAARIVNGLAARGLLVGLCGRHGNVLKIRPPLTITSAETDLIVRRLDAEVTRLA